MSRSGDCGRWRRCSRARRGGAGRIDDLRCWVVVDSGGDERPERLKPPWFCWLTAGLKPSPLKATDFLGVFPQAVNACHDWGRSDGLARRARARSVLYWWAWPSGGRNLSFELLLYIWDVGDMVTPGAGRGIPVRNFDLNVGFQPLLLFKKAEAASCPSRAVRQRRVLFRFLIRLKSLLLRLKSSLPYGREHQAW
jgi:hypothetical protein